MSRDSSAERLKESVMRAMMADLGSGRLEEFAHEGGRQQHQRRTQNANPTSLARSARPRNAREAANPAAASWNMAVEEGKFDDDDAAAVKGLDTLDGGNAHRINRMGDRPFEQLVYSQSSTKLTMASSRRPTYDPSEPTYSRRGRLRNKDPNMGTPRDLYNMSGGPVLGGLCPEGGEVKRWESGRLVNGTHQPTITPNLPAGRGYNAPSQSPFSPSVTEVPGQGRGRGGLVRSPKPVAIGKSITLPQIPKTIALQPQIPIGLNEDRLTPSPLSPINGTDKGSTTVQAREHHLVSTPKTTTTGPTPNKGTEVIQNGLPVRDAPSLDDSWVPPHLRKPIATRSTASPSPAVSRPHSPQPNGPKLGITILTQCEDLHKIPSLNAQEIFFQDDIKVRDSDGANNLVNARIVIYKLLDVQVCVWELMIGTTKIIRGDIRDLRPVLLNGSAGFLRRYRKGTPLRSNQLHFSGIDEAVMFSKEANFRRDQFAGSTGTLYDEISVELPTVEHVVDCKTESSLTPKVEEGSQGRGQRDGQTSPSHHPLTNSLPTASEPVNDFTATAGRVSWTCQSGVLRGSNTDITTEGQGETKPVFKPVPVAKITQQNVMPRTDTPFLSLSTTTRPKTPPGPAVVNHKRSGSGWDDNEDLMCFSPNSPTRSQHSDELTSLEPQPSSGLSSESSNSVEVPGALNIFETHETLRPSPESLAVIDQVSGDYDRLIRRSMVLSRALDTPYQRVASAVTSEHLLGNVGFMSLSLDDQKECFSVVVSVVGQGTPPIVRSAEQIRFLRTGEEPCPDAVMELNNLIQRHRPGVRISQPAYRPKEEKKTNGHRRSSTADTMTKLACQLASLDMK